MLCIQAQTSATRNTTSIPLTSYSFGTAIFVSFDRKNSTTDKLNDLVRDTTQLCAPGISRDKDMKIFCCIPGVVRRGALNI